MAKVTLDTINTQHAKAAVLCVVLLFAAAPTAFLGWKPLGYNLGLLLVITSVVGWIWSATEASWRRMNWLKGYYDE